MVMSYPPSTNSPSEVPPSEKIEAEVRPPSPLKFIVNPQLLVFPRGKAQKVTKELQISNSSPFRMGWRVLSNAPTRYAVSPNKGFLNSQETVTVRILLIGADKYNRRHNFIVQGKLVDHSENNRKEVWNKSDGAVKNIRVNTDREKLVIGKSDISSESSARNTISSVSSASNDSGTSSVNSTGASPLQPAQPQDHGAHSAKIEELIRELQAAVAEKEKRTAMLVSIVNEVKRIEVELDRVGQTAYQLSQKYETALKMHQELSARAVIAKQELNEVKGNHPS